MPIRPVLTLMRSSRHAFRFLRSRHTLALFVGPYGELVAVGILEVEAPSARKAEERIDDLGPRSLQASLRFHEIIGIKDHQRSARLRTVAFGKAAGQAAIAELAIVGAVVLEAPAEGLAVCGFRRSRTVFPIVKPDTVPIRSRTRFRFDAGQSGLCFLGSC